MRTDFSNFKPKIDLLDNVGFGAIISYPSGVIYSNQTGGTCCLHPEIEGVFIPLANDCNDIGELRGPSELLFNYFDRPKYNGSGAARGPKPGLDEEDALAIEKILSQYNLTYLFQIDRNRLHDSHEAWVWCNIVAEDLKFGVFHNFMPYPRPAVLTWQNSD
jgi:hypothetical protein